ncbi:MAG TPA: glyceraldehyde-3-phosphate dehydrogenase, partial [Gammaproteobacteria bacterium]|nr:glyceraldehyde-3-phosphate dehydrogenase [Gammaproteobacteria bacterium]
MIPLIGKLYRDNVVVYCYGRALYNQSVTQLMKTHRYVRQVAQNELSEFETFPILQSIAGMNLGPCHIDLGKLATKYMDDEASAKLSAEEYTKQECQSVIGATVPPISEPQDVVLYGFGRIGRLLARLLIEKTGSGGQLRLRAIVVRRASDDDIVKRASLLRRDSVHGSFRGTIRVDEENECIIANGNVIRVIYA